MLCTSTFLSWFALSIGASASYSGNLNYRSPSLRHSGMGVNIDILQSRSLTKRDEPPSDPKQLRFTHGVASGDPYADSVILWTRVAPSMKSDDSNKTVSGNVGLYNHDTEPYITASPHPICVEYKVFAEENCGKVVYEGQAYTTSDIDYTVKVTYCSMPFSAEKQPNVLIVIQVEAEGLKPFTSYWYQFKVCDSEVISPVGRTKTAPRAGDKTEEIKLAVHSCSNYSMRGFTH